MRPLRLASPVLVLATTLACGGGSATPATPVTQAGPAIDPTTAATIHAFVVFEGTPLPEEMVRLDADPACVTQNGGRERPAEHFVLGEGRALQNVFVYVKDGLGRARFPVPTDPVVLDQMKCRYLPRVFGVRVGQPLAIRNSDPLLHNVRAEGAINQPFNMGHPAQGATFTRTLSTGEVMLPFKCDVHPWMQAWAGVVDHPFYGVTDATGRVPLAGLPPGTYTVEAWHERLGTRTQQLTVGAKESKDVTFTFTR